jgi:hypothetical protein
MNETKSCQKVAPKFTCEICDYYTCKKSSYDKHLLTVKHLCNISDNLCNNKVANLICKKCDTQFGSRVTLWRHKKICNSVENIIIQDSSANEIKVLTNIVLELVKSNTDLQKQVLDVCKNMQPSTINNTNNTNSNNTTNNHNKTFNLQFFLNEQCKDAMNIKDFVKSIQIEMSDIEKVGKDGYVEGISKLIIEKLRNTDIFKRPLHCSDAKRETLYIKENDVWNKDESLNNEKMIRFVKDVDNKNYDFLMAYALENPEVFNQDSSLHTPYLHMVIKSTRDAEVVNKVIKRIVKEVIINKDLLINM